MPRLAIIIIALLVTILVRRLHQILTLRELERLHGCEQPPNEKDRFRYDILGIAKAIELAFYFRRRSSLAYTNALFEKYGETYTSNVLGYRLILTCNAENTKCLLSTAFADFDSSPLRKPLFEPITPHGIFTLDGAGWKKSRNKLRSRLSDLRKIIDLSLCEQHFQAFLRHVPSNGKAFNVQTCVFNLVLDMQTLFSLGVSVDTLGLSQPLEKKQFVADLLYIKEKIVEDGFRGPLRYLYSKQRFVHSCRRAREYVMSHATQNEKDEDLNRETDQALSILLANDSMGTALSALFYCLSQDDRVVDKLRASIIDTIGLNPPTWGQLGSLDYIRCVLQEVPKVMRLYPAVVLNARVANKNVTLPTGGGAHGISPILARKGEIVVFSTWARHRLGRDFGENPEHFHPERWEQLNADMPGFIPFNKGPRSCPGRKPFSQVTDDFAVVG
ncbi:cytochrome P450 [Penicillium robsamsonii]|uniref:cytochrome P450 n=1 Tax=Penicillium robsamsonii TaxID=1792511 RepID=UPI0025469112|nr:cytochrome P450 [Penicillium robsamsonii]KAJ5827877.1 cytochrome P450 [Penicillium robsamsonii]